jgi:hypothetical protein
MVKSDIKKGLRGVPLDGKTLRYTHGNVGLFAQAGYEKLLEQDRIQKGAGIDSNYLMATYLTNEDILELALFYGLKADQPDVKLEDMAGLADTWAESGKSDMDLRRKILEAFNLATNPSGVASMIERWQASDRQEEETRKQAVEDQKMDKKVEEARIAANRRIKKTEITRLENIAPSPDLLVSS